MSGYDSDSGSSVNTDAGAEGSSSGSFSLSTGGLVAIIVVVAFVVIAGVSISVLWYLAKRRQWDVRASLRRASRRLTGRGPAQGYTKQRSANGDDRKARRAGAVQMDAIPAASKKKNQMRPVVTEVRDLEKGLPPRNQPQQQYKQQPIAPEQAPGKTGRWSWVDRLHVATDDGR